MMNYNKLILKANLLLVALMCLNSCSKGDQGIGFDFSGEDKYGHILDTVTVYSEIVRTDSISTSASGQLIAGIIRNQDKTKLRSRAYFNISLPVLNYAYYANGNTLVVDSVTFIFEKNQIIGDTLSSQTFTLHELLESVPDNENQYPGSEKSFDKAIVARHDGRIRKGGDSAVYLSPESRFAERIWDIYRENKENAALLLKREIKGLVLNPEEGNTILSYFPVASSVLRYYVHDIKDGKSYTIDFPFKSGADQFNTYSYSFQGQDIKAGLGKKAVSTKEFDNLMLVQNGLGVATKISIPALDKLRESSLKYRLVKAELVVYSTRKNNKELPVPPQSLIAYKVNLNNELVESVTAASGVTVEADYAISYEEVYFNSYYTFDITDYLKNILNAKEQNKGFVIMSSNALSTSEPLNSVLLGDKDKSAYRCKLKLYHLD
jgi:hypothetical protein